METVIAHLFGPLGREDRESSFSSSALEAYWHQVSLLSKDQKSKDSSQKSLFIFIDGGWHHFKNYHKYFCDSQKTIEENLSGVQWIGDADGLYSSDLQEDYWKKVPKNHLNKEKDYSDLLAAFRWLDEFRGERTITQIFGHGLIGGRLDHQLAIFGDIRNWLLESYPSAEQSEATWPSVHLLDVKGRDCVTVCSPLLETSHQGTFSIFSSRPVKISIQGEVQYKGVDIHLRPYSSVGLSNEAQGKFKVECKEEPLLLMKNFAL